MKVLVVAPGKAPEDRETSGTLESMQKIVGGLIEAVYPFAEPVALICNDEGKLLGLPLNRALFDPDTHALLDIISGPFFLCGAPADAGSFTSLTAELTETYKKRFAVPEQFIQVGGSIFVLPQDL